MKAPAAAKLLDRFLRAANASAFAEAIGVHRSYVCHLRKGRQRPSLDVAQSIERETHGEVPVAAWVR